MRAPFVRALWCLVSVSACISSLELGEASVPN
jgi:hypothetical protein